VEVRLTSTPFGTPTLLARLDRDKDGRVAALEVSTGRIKKMRFERTD